MATWPLTFLGYQRHLVGLRRGQLPALELLEVLHHQGSEPLLWLSFRVYLSMVLGLGLGCCDVLNLLPDKPHTATTLGRERERKRERERERE